MSDQNPAPPPLPLPPPPPSRSGGGGCLKFAMIGCGALVVLFIVAVVGLGVWWKRNGGELQESGAAASRDGARFGLVRDEAACFEEGKRRAAESSTFQGTFTVGVFVRACMEYSKPTPGYCDNVPPTTSIGRSAAWQAQRCGEDMICRNVSQVVQTYCNEGRPKRTAADTLLMETGDGDAPPAAADSSSF